jgi:hypothetical protein
MYIIFKIYKKVRELKREEREIIKNIERHKKSLSDLRADINKGYRNYVTTHQEGYLIDIHKKYKREKEYLRKEKEELRKEKEELRKEAIALRNREKEIDAIQRKLNDQILKLGIVEGINNGGNNVS